MTTLHERRNELESEGSCRSAYIARLNYYDPVDWDNVTDEQLTRRQIPREVFPMLKEIQQQPANDKEREKAELKVLLTSLSKRIKPTPGPRIPDTVWQEACSGERQEWPNLREDEYDALKALSDPDDCPDLYPKEMMCTFGEYLASHHTKRQLKHWLEVMYKYEADGIQTPLDDMNRAQLLAKLTFEIISAAMEATGYHSLEHCAGLLMMLSEGELRDAAMDYGLATNGNKVQLVARLVEYFFSQKLM